MKKLTAILFFTVFGHISLLAQNFPTEFGSISGEELKMTSYDEDPDAEAVVLYDKGNTFFEYTYSEGFNILFTRRKRIKIFNSAGLEHAEIEIPYYVDGYGTSEKVRNIKAIVYNLENGYQIDKTVLENDKIFDEQVNEHWRIKKFALPGVKEGSVLEYEYELWTPFHFNLPDWEFQSSIPTIFSEYTLRLIPFYEYIYILQGDQAYSFDSKLGVDRHAFGIDYRETIYTFSKKRISAFKDESFITSKGDYISKLDFQLSKVTQPTGISREIMSTWPKLIEEYLDHENFGKFIKKAEKIASKEIIPKLDLAYKSEIETAKTLVEFLKENIHWDGYYGRYADKKPQDFWKEKSGNIAELNLFAIGALKAAGIKAHPLLLSTRNHGKIHRSYPFSNSFNYVSILMENDGKLVMSDISEPLLSFDRLPPRCINDLGLIIEEDKENWIDLSNASFSYNNYQFNLKVIPDSLKSKIMVNRSCMEMEAFNLKRKYKNEEEKLIEKIESDDLIQVNRLITRNYEKKHLPYLISFDGETPLEKFGSQYVIRPFLNTPIAENPLKEDERTYPVDFIYKQSEDFQSNIDIPEGFHISYAPEDFIMSNDLIDINLATIFNGQQLVIKGSYGFKKSVYDPSEYQQLKEHIDTLVKKFNDSVILEKSETNN